MGQLLLFQQTKTCSKCRKELPVTVEYFNRSKTRADGSVKLDARCRTCQRRMGREYADSVKERQREYQKRRRAENWEHVRKLERERQARRKDKTREYQREYNKANAERIRRRSNAWTKKKRRENPTYRISENMSSGIWQSLKNGKEGRKWETVVGYTARDLMRHLESLFQPGMTWENYGKFGWHVDHIRPISSFDFSSFDDPQFKECWGLANLQPLWWDENLRKKDKIIA